VGRKIGMSGRVINFIVLSCIVFIYVLYNIQPVAVRFLFWEAQVSKALISLGSLLAGIILGFILAKIDQFKKVRKKKAPQRQREKEGG
jgi:uncharacterized integral membrane protein